LAPLPGAIVVAIWKLVVVGVARTVCVVPLSVAHFPARLEPENCTVCPA
jgi:hypothetical protein